jgi:hypothetical protein
VTVFPTSPRPVASNLNLSTGAVRPNLVTVKVNQAAGTVTIYNEAGSIDLVADVAGWYGP